MDDALLGALLEKRYVIDKMHFQYLQLLREEGKAYENGVQDTEICCYMETRKWPHPTLNFLEVQNAKVHAWVRAGETGPDAGLCLAKVL